MIVGIGLWGETADERLSCIHAVNVASLYSFAL